MNFEWKKIWIDSGISELVPPQCLCVGAVSEPLKRLEQWVTRSSEGGLKILSIRKRIVEVFFWAKEEINREETDGWRERDNDEWGNQQLRRWSASEKELRSWKEPPQNPKRKENYTLEGNHRWKIGDEDLCEFSKVAKARGRAVGSIMAQTGKKTSFQSYLNWRCSWTAKICTKKNHVWWRFRCD